MIEDAYEILDYLPYSYKSTTEQDYINFLWDSFQSNFNDEKYQFSLLAYHMLFMSFVYFNIWQIKSYYKEVFEHTVIGFPLGHQKALLNGNSPFEFSLVKESSIFQYFQMIKCNSGKIGRYKKLVKNRNNIAHASGHIYYDNESAVENEIVEILRCVREIQESSKLVITECFKNFLIDNWDNENREYIEDNDQIREELIHKHYFSKNDIKFCLEYDLRELTENEHFNDIKGLFDCFYEEYNEE